MTGRVSRFIVECWYRGCVWLNLLRPLSWLFGMLVRLRRQAYASGRLPSQFLPVPIIVVGNITAGGSGKTPLVVWLVEFLRQAGYRPGVVSRGYGGRARNWPQQVRPDSDPVTVGDEAVLLARRCACPVAVGPDRVAAVRAMLEHTDVNVVISDDGLQHYAMRRDIEIAVIDGDRRHGNGRLLPAGPLREPVTRLEEVDLVVANGHARRGEYGMSQHSEMVRSVLDENKKRGLDRFRGETVHAVAGIGNPRRFFKALRARGLELKEHAFADHYRYKSGELDFADEAPILMTEKDAVKWRRFADTRAWYVPVSVQMNPHFGPRVLKLLTEWSEHGQETA